MLTALNDSMDMAAMLHGVRLSKCELLKRKYLYMEGLVRFLELYANNELGVGEVDIRKVCLWIFSPCFENVDIYGIKTTHSVYKQLEEDLLHGVPLYRFLNLSQYQLDILEAEHREFLKVQMMEQAESLPCLRCVWYGCTSTPMGVSCKCSRPYAGLAPRASAFNPRRHKRCRYVTTVDILPDSFSSIISYTGKDRFEKQLLEARTAWLNMYENLDNSVIPACFSEVSLLDFDKLVSADEDAWATELGRVLGGCKPYSQLRKEYESCLIFEAMLRFVEVYIQQEVGSGYCASISKIASYVFGQQYKRNLKFASEQDVYAWLEGLVLDGFDMLRFCKREGG